MKASVVVEQSATQDSRGQAVWFGHSIEPRVGFPVGLGRWRDLVVACVLFALALWHLLGAIEATPFHRDEARWIHRAAYLRALADPFGSRWVEEGLYPGSSLDERFPLRAQPPLGAYLMGIGLRVQGRDLTTNGFWNMDRDEAWNRAHGNMPAPEDLAAGRRTNAVVAALAVVGAYFVGTRLSNRVGGVVAALVLLLHPLTVSAASIAGSDALLILLVAVATLAAYDLAERPSGGGAVRLGILLGLGGATKLSPLLVAPLLAALGVTLLLANWARRRRANVAPGGRGDRLGWHLIAVPLVAYLTFIAVYPYLWRAPVAHTYNLLTFRAQAMELQAGLWRNVAVDSPQEALRRVGAKLGNEFSTSGWLTDELEERLGVDWPVRTQGIDLGLALVGAVLLVAAVLQRGPRSGHALAAVVVGGQTAVIVLGMRADFPRYHLPIALAVAVCVGIVAGQAWARLGLGRQSPLPTQAPEV
jgi:hypothetical protein